MAENDVRSRWLVLLYNQECQSLGKTSTSMSLWFPDSETQNILNTWNWEWKTMQAQENQFYIESGGHCHRRCQGCQKHKIIILQKKKSKSEWAKKRACIFFLQLQQRQVRRSQPDKPIHSPRDSLISWRFVKIQYRAEIFFLSIHRSS